MPAERANQQKFAFFLPKSERLVDLNLYQFGWEECVPMYSFGPYRRNHYLIHLILSGKGSFNVGEHHYALTAGQGFLICPRQITSYEADAQEPWKYAWVEFDGLLARSNLYHAGLSERQPIFRPRSRADAKAVQDSLMALIEHHDDSLVCQLGLTYLFLDRLIRCSTTRKEMGNQSLRDFYVQEAITFIERNYRDDISVEDIANACGLNRSYFGRIFHESIGKTPQHFLLHYRMAKAAEMLTESRLPIGQICVQVGYPNQLHFSRAFKEIYSVSPRQYRQEKFIHELLPPL